MAMNTCDTCKWWEGPSGISFRSIGKCKNESLGRVVLILDIEPDNLGVFGISDEEKHPVVTGPKFGCVHHEPK